jgi:5'-3' exonuclease
MGIPFSKAAEEGNNVIIVDCMNLAFSFFRKSNTPDQGFLDDLINIDIDNQGSRFAQPEVMEFHEEYLALINSLKKSYKAKYVICAADKGQSSYRLNLHPEYKGNRKKKVSEQTDAEAEQFKQFFAGYQVCLNHIQETTEYPLLQYANVEADDIAAYICGLKLPVEHTVLISTDKDWDLLLSDKVSRFSYVTRKDYTKDNWATRYDFSIEDYISIKCLQGDSGDNVFGVRGVGPKRAEALVAQYGSALDILDALPLDSKLKYIQDLNESGGLIELNYRLMDLVTFCEEAVGADNCISVKETLGEYFGCEL